MQFQCTSVNASIKNNLTDLSKSPTVSRDSLLSLVELVRRLYEQRDSSDSHGLENHPRRTSKTNNNDCREIGSAQNRIGIISGGEIK